jgi:hypothetical protein
LGSKELSELFKRTDAANYEQLKKKYLPASITFTIHLATDLFSNFVPDFDEFFEEALEQVSEDGITFVRLLQISCG